MWHQRFIRQNCYFRVNYPFNIMNVLRKTQWFNCTCRVFQLWSDTERANGVRSARGGHKALVPLRPRLQPRNQLLRQERFLHAAARRLPPGRLPAEQRLADVVRPVAGGDHAPRPRVRGVLGRIGAGELAGVSGDPSEPQNPVDHQLFRGVDGVCGSAVEPSLRAASSPAGLRRPLASDRGRVQSRAIPPAPVPRRPGLRASVHLRGSFLHHCVSVEL